MESIFEKQVDNAFPFKLAIMSGSDSFMYHWHDMVEILYSINGTFKIGIENENYEVSEQEIIIIGNGESHCLFPADNTSKRIAILVTASFILSRNGLDENKDRFSQIKKHSAQWPAESQEKVRDCIQLMHKEYKERNPGWKEMIYSELLRLSAISLRELPDAEKTRSHSSQCSALRQVLEYLGDKFKNDISLKSCAAQLGFNESYLSSMFKKNTGTSFHSYLQNIRLNEAAWLLKNQEFSIGEVAERSGFSSLKTFHRVFSDKYGLSPGAYRSKERDTK